MQDLMNALLRHTSGEAGMTATTRVAIIDSVDPVNHAARVRIQPEDVLTGWLPLNAVAVGAASIVALPNIGDQVLVHPQEGAAEQWHITGRLFDTASPPPVSPATGKQVQSGEIGLFGKAGSFIHMTAAGNITAAGGTISLTAPLVQCGDGTATPLATQHFVTSIFDAHTHNAPAGGGTTSGPTPTHDAASLTTKLKGT